MDPTWASGCICKSDRPNDIAQLGLRRRQQSGEANGFMVTGMTGADQLTHRNHQLKDGITVKRLLAALFGPIVQTSSGQRADAGFEARRD
jgi:hypothetical protein